MKLDQKPWGQLTVLDLYDCNRDRLLDEEGLKRFNKDLCARIGMKRHGEAVVDHFGEGNLYGISSMQFIETSTVVVHLDDKGGRAFIDIFSCKEFDAHAAEQQAREYFQPKKIESYTRARGGYSS